jgi:hypothetical protein
LKNRRRFLALLEMTRERGVKAHRKSDQPQEISRVARNDALPLKEVQDDERPQPLIILNLLTLDEGGGFHRKC